MTTTLIPVLCAIVAAAVAIGLTPLASMFARRVGAVDQPSGRRIHTKPTPRLGGLAIMGAVLVPSLYYMPADPEARALIAGAVLVGALGAVDDIFGLDPIVKLAGQVACAAVPVSAGLTIDHITLGQAAKLAPGRPSTNCMWRWCRPPIRRRASSASIRARRSRCLAPITYLPARNWLGPPIHCSMDSIRRRCGAIRSQWDRHAIAANGWRLSLPIRAPWLKMRQSSCR